MPSERRVLEARRMLDMTDPNPSTAKGDRVMFWAEGVVIESYPRKKADGTIEHVSLIDIDRMHTAMIVSEP